MAGLAAKIQHQDGLERNMSVVKPWNLGRHVGELAVPRQSEETQERNFTHVEVVVRRLGIDFGGHLV